MRDTIDMAREAGIEFQRNTGALGKETISTMGSQRIEWIERLVALVRADEREACAKIAWSMEPDENGPIETTIRARGNT
jgi:hypothetical protein